MRAELFQEARNGVGESPVWLQHQQALYWVDIINRRVYAKAISSEATLVTWELPEMVGSIAWIGADKWLLAMQTGIFTARLHSDGTVTELLQVAPVTHAMEGMRFNDGRTDARGRFWVSTMLMDMSKAAKVGALYCLTGTDLQEIHPHSLIIGNGLAFSPRGDVAYLADSHPSVQTVWAFDYDLDAGIMSNRRTFIDFNPLAGRPDGAAVDEDGCYWICANDGAAVFRYTPQGRLDKTIELPVKKPTMCAFGGDKLDTLFIASIRPQGDLSDQPLAGSVFCANVGVRGLPEPAFVERPKS
jgi:sugar lactone lactonase YvrE